MRTISIKELDNINDVRSYLMFLSSVLQGWYLGAKELDTNTLKEAFGELHMQLYDVIEKLNIDKFTDD